MEKELLIGDKNYATYGSNRVLSPRIAQGASTYLSPFEGASAPPYELMDNSPLDEKTSTEDSENKSFSDIPDQLNHKEHEELPPHLREENILFVSEQDVKEAFLQYAARKRFYRTAPAKHMKVQNLTCLNTYKYRLETFTEMRYTHLASELYNGGFVDSPDVSPPPAPWEIIVDPPPLFTDCEMNIPVPHSYSVENCPNCKGRGAIMCQSCKGTGKKKCSACLGTGTSTLEDNNICTWCSGTGDNRCFSCRSNGWLKCYRCNGDGVLLFHTQLTITWKNNVLEHVADKNSGLPLHHLQEVTGKKILSDEHNSVFPIVDFPEPSIDEYSQACIAQHRMQFTSEGLHRILRQKQTIVLVPLTKAEYEWKGKVYSFYIFGNEKKVYTKDYPGKCCCSIM
ncbi:protein SSUH2 homolog isoform X3 [Rhineura floridana]|uniref:protein SSUH2 homolog isoform X3 n=1 Tax=Rhineura floridana TaxID=261503 RepID=UPI002AC85024|nr:protein SSUH2 homolog isoform X3 [Rhineura floridana]